jgi:hypothetical protein
MKKFLLFSLLALLVQALISCAAPVRKDTEAQIDESRIFGLDSKRLFELIVDRGTEPNNLIYQSCFYAHRFHNEVGDGAVDPFPAMCTFDKKNRIFHVSYVDGLFIRDYHVVDIPLSTVVNYSSFETEGDSLQKSLKLKRFKGQFQIRTRGDITIFMNFDSFTDMDAELRAFTIPKISPTLVYWWDMHYETGGWR